MRSKRSGSRNLNRLDKFYSGFLPRRQRPWLEIPMSKSFGRRTRRVFSPAFKARVALVAFREDKTLAELSQTFELYPNPIIGWNKLLLAQAPSVFSAAAVTKDPSMTDLGPTSQKF